MCFHILRRRWRDRRATAKNGPNGKKRTHTFPIFGNRSLGGILSTVAAIVAPPQDVNGQPVIKIHLAHSEAKIECGPARGNYDGHHLTPVMQCKLEQLYLELTGGPKHRYLRRSAFVEFLKGIQGEAEAEAHLDKEKEKYTFHDFLQVLMMEFGCDVIQRPKGYEKDLSRPITNYFINSSHNTYLLGNQVTSSSSPEAYKMVLLRGCRCVEIDVWNGDTTFSDAAKQSQHMRAVSGESIPNIAANIRDMVEEKVESTKAMLSRDSSPMPPKSASMDRSPSHSSRRGRPSPRDSSMTLGAGEGSEAQDRDRTPSRARTYPRDEPIVTHGWTASRPCGFREVCKAIMESAFVINDLPLIISLEVHADEQQQEAMVRIMKEEWGPFLLDEAFDHCDPKFHSPKLEDLRNKILIKVKKAGKLSVISPPTISSLAPAPSIPDDSASEDDRSINLHSPPHSPAIPQGAQGQGSKPKRVPICQALSSLAIYTFSQHFQGMDDKNWKKPGHIYSISESRIIELFQGSPERIFQHNKNHFMRAFPAGIRFDSSNPDPVPFWRAGVQMVAMNWQSLDDGMMFNEGMFADDKGWVLKPEGYRSRDAAEMHLDAIPNRITDLKITVLAGQHVFVPGVNEDGEKARSAGSLRPSVKCELHFDTYKKDKDKRERECNGGAPTLDSKLKKTKCGETDHPDFGHDGCELLFEGIPGIVEELSFVRFRIEDESSMVTPSRPLLAWSCIRLDRLRSGYRFVGLLDPRGNPIPGGKLLVKVEKTVRDANGHAA